MSAPRNDGSVRTGYTMIELLTVLAMIAILAAILFPVFSRAREAARSHACASNLYQIGMALHAYAHDNDGRLPPADNDFRPIAVPYMNELAVFICPSDAHASGPRAPASRSQGRDPGLIALSPGPFLTSYQYRCGLSLGAAGETPVAADWSFLHNERANVLYLSGVVRRVPPSEWTAFGTGPRPLPPGETGDDAKQVTPFRRVLPRAGKRGAG